MSDEIVVVAVAESRPGCEAELETAIRACVGPTRKEEGCLLYAIHADLKTPQRFVFIERWASRSALAAHEKQPHFETLKQALGPLLASPLQITLLRDLP